MRSECDFFEAGFVEVGTLEVSFAEEGTTEVGFVEIASAVFLGGDMPFREGGLLPRLKWGLDSKACKGLNWKGRFSSEKWN